MVDVVVYGRNSDRETLASAFGRALRQGALDLLEDTPLPGAEEQSPIPHVFLTDEAIPPRRDMQRPYDGQTERQQAFNFRLSLSREWLIVLSTF